jgi:hypothetical protein
MDINKIFDGSLDEIANNIFNETKNTTDKAKEIQQQKIAENVQYVIDALKKIEADLRGEYGDVADKLSERILSIKDGKDGRNGADGRDGKDGRPGRDGLPGAKGADGLPGRDGIDGNDGVSVIDAHIDFDGSLIINLSNGQVINVGEVVSQDLADKIQVISTMSTNTAIANITGGTIDNTVIGGTTPAAGAFTTLSATGAATFAAGIVLVGTTTASGTNLLQVNSDALVNTLTVGRGPGNLQTNAVLGYQALNGGTATGSNVAIGYQALFTAAAAGADRQVAIGYQALYSNNDTTGAVNIGIGYLAGKAATGKSNLFIGGYCSYLRTTGDGNTFVGASSGTNFSSAPTGSSNTAFGASTLSGLTTGFNNVAVGYASGQSVATGSCNVFVGEVAGALATGSSNVFIGGGNTNGGRSAGQAQTSGNNNTYIGTASGSSVTTGSSNVILGAYTGTAAPISLTGSNSIVFSDGAANVRQYYDGTNSAWVFNTGASERMRIDSSGNVGIGATANASAILDAQSTTKGVRMPNMTTTQKNNIASPAAGLMVFDTTLAKLCVYSGSAWQTITSV